MMFGPASTSADSAAASETLRTTAARGWDTVRAPGSKFECPAGLRIHDARCILNDDPPRPRARPLFKDCVAFYRVLQAGDEGLLSFFMIAG